jgi:very-short-patch-repair endonuclease
MKFAQSKISVKKKHSKYIVEYLSNHNGYDHHHISKPERILAYALLNNEISFVRQQPIGGFCVVDFLLPLSKIIIEIYGDYWHANPKKYKANKYMRNGMKAKDIWKRDKTRIKKIDKFGYKVIVLWEYEVLNNVKECLKKIKEVQK